jgi:arginyl-tRNA synthetase
MTIEYFLKESIAKGLKQLFDVTISGGEVALQPTKQEFEGTYTFVAFTFVKLTKKSPEETGRLLGEHLMSDLSMVAGFNVVKGFLNIIISDNTWITIFKEIIQTANYGSFPKNGKKVMVEYSSPNTNKPLHLGHLRNNFLGFSVAEILKEKGFEVSKVNLVNDRGIHICKSMLAYTLKGNGETPESSGLKGDHLIGKYYVLFDQMLKEQVAVPVASGQTEEEAKKNAPLMKEAQHMLLQWESGDEKIYSLWKKMNDWVYAGFEATYQTIGVNFDKTYYESDTYLLGKNVVSEGLKENAFYKKEDGSVWVDLREDGLDEKLLLRGDGTSVYITQDLGTADLKYKEFQADHSLYVVGNEQDYHFKVLQLILKKLGRPYADGIFHLSYGMVDLPSGKMKSREGTVVDADDLVREMFETAEAQTRELGKIDDFTETEAQELYKKLGLGALKYFLLKVDPKKRMLFNPKESVEFQGNTGPFIQYTFARISAIVRKAVELEIPFLAPDFKDLEKLHETERELIIILNNFPAVISEAASNYAPSLLAQYVYDVAKLYNRFYTEVSIFQAHEKQQLSFRIALSKQTAMIIEKAMRLLGIQVPDRM